MTSEAGNQSKDKDIVRDYFNSVGFDRWRRIYGDGEVNRVQLDIRMGHQQTIDKVLGWLEADGDVDGMTICDAGCGTGNLSIPLSAMSAKVYASDISAKMVEEAQSRAANPNNPTFEVSDLASLSGSYHTVICLDVLIHYPMSEVESMVRHLESLAQTRLILSFAPKTVFYSMLKKVGEFFPGPSKATRAYLHSEADIRRILSEAGFTVQRDDMTKTKFYFSRLLEAVKQ